MKLLCVYLLLFCLVVQVSGQQKLAGRYLPQYRSFIPADTNIIIQNDNDAALIPFLIKGKNPDDYSTNRAGFMDTLGNVVVPPVYNNCGPLYKGNALVGNMVNNAMRFGLVNKQGKLVFPPVYTGISFCTNGLLMLKKDSLIGFADTSGRWVVPLKKYSAYALSAFPIFIEGDDTPYNYFRWHPLTLTTGVYFSKYIGVRAGKKWAIIDSTGAEILSPTFDQMEPFRGRYASAKQGKYWGAVTYMGKWLIPPEHDRVATGKGIFYVYQKDLQGVYTADNKLLIPIRYNQIEPFGSGFTAYFNNYGSMVLYDKDGKLVADTTDKARNRFPVWGNEYQGFWVYNKYQKRFNKYQEIIEESERHNRILIYKRNGHWGLMDTTGKELTPADYDYLDIRRSVAQPGRMEKALIQTAKDDKWGMVNGNGKVLFKPIYDDRFKKEQNRIIVKKQGLYGVFNNEMQPITKLKYDSIIITVDGVNYSNYLASNSAINARLHGKWGLLDTNNHQLTPLVYDEPLWFYHTFGRFSLNGKLGLINNKGKILTPNIYDELVFVPDGTNGYVYDGRFLVKKDGKWGVIDTAGHTIVPLIYQKIIKLNGRLRGKYQIVNNYLSGMLDAGTGRVMIPCTFREIKFYRTSDTNSPDPYMKQLPYFIAKKNGSYGLIDTLGKTVLPFNYYTIRVYDDTHYFVAKYDNGSSGLISSGLKVIIPPKFSYLSNYYSGVYIVHSLQYVGLIAESGEVIAEPIYNSIDVCGNYIIAKKDGKFGAMDKKGNIVKQFIYTAVRCENDKLVTTQ